MANDRKRTDASGDRWEETPWSLLVVVCETCAKHSGRKGLRSELKAGLKTASQHRRVKVVESGCLGLCPKRGIALSSPAALALGRIFVLGESAPVQDAVDALLRASE